MISKIATLIMPVYNGFTTLPQVFEGLESQLDKRLINQIIFINDNSTDDSKTLIENYIDGSSYSCLLINNKKNKGLADGYNVGIQRATTEFIITMHQDIVLNDKSSFHKIISPLMNDLKAVACYPTLLHPRYVWNTYNFWQKAMFSRFVEKKIPLLSGKFDCFRRSALIKAGCFDANTFRTAGEDGDLKRKFETLKYHTVPSKAEVVHIHNHEPNFGAKNYIKKEAQLAEAQGVLLRKHGISSVKDFGAVFFRQILLFALIIPGLNIISTFVIIAYSFIYCSLTFTTQQKNPRLLYLPLINIYILFVATYFSIRGYITRGQTL